MRASRRLPLDALEPYLLEVPHPGFLPPDSPLLAPAPVFAWPDVFGNAHPVEIEVGFGKGMFLVSSAPARPGTQLLRHRNRTQVRLAYRGTCRTPATWQHQARLHRRTLVPTRARRRGKRRGHARLFPRSVVEESPSQAQAFNARLCGAMRARVASGGPISLHHRRRRLFRGNARNAQASARSVADGTGPARRSTNQFRTQVSPGRPARFIVPCIAKPVSIGHSRTLRLIVCAENSACRSLFRCT